MGKRTLFLLLEIFLKTISTRDIKKRPATLHTLPFNSFMSPVHPESRLLEDIHEKERESDAMLFKAITTSRHPSCRTFSYLPA